MDSFWWFVAAVVVFGAHALYLRSWQAERARSLAEWHKYDEASERRHAEFMAALRSARAAWSQKRGQA